MGHYLAELITAAEAAPPEQRAEVGAACAAAVLEVWRNRNALPKHLRPLGEVEPVLATIASLSVKPDDFRYHPEPLRTAALAEAQGTTKQWLDLALGMDHAARVMIGVALRAAAAGAADSAESWVDLARQAGAEPGRENALIGFLNPYPEAEETEDSRRRGELEDQVRRLRSFAEMASVIADDIQTRLDPASQDE